MNNATSQDGANTSSFRSPTVNNLTEANWYWQKTCALEQAKGEINSHNHSRHRLLPNHGSLIIIGMILICTCLLLALW
jgi:hypothetical protein